MLTVKARGASHFLRAVVFKKFQQGLSGFLVNFGEINPDIVDVSNPLNMGNTALGSDRPLIQRDEHLKIVFHHDRLMGLDFDSTLTEVLYFSRLYPEMGVCDRMIAVKT